MRRGKRTPWATYPNRFPYIRIELHAYACICENPRHGESKKYPGEYSVCLNCEKYHRYVFRVCDDCDEFYISNFRSQFRIAKSCSEDRCFACWEKRGRPCDCESCTKYSDPMYAKDSKRVEPRLVIRPARDLSEVLSGDFSFDDLDLSF